MQIIIGFSEFAWVLTYLIFDIFVVVLTIGFVAFVEIVLINPFFQGFN